jgi:acyl-CoA thioesterase I
VKVGGVLLRGRSRHKIEGVATPPRRVLGLLALLAIVGVGLALLWPRTDVPVAPAGPDRPASAPTVVFLGDSITSGHLLPKEQAFPHRVGAALGVRIVNAGISGDTTGNGLGRLERDVLAERPDLVVVELGVNDALGQLPADRTIANLRAITRRIREHGAGVVLLHIRLPQLGVGGHPGALLEIARTEGATLVENFLDGVVPELSYDGLHPDAAGQAALADRLLPVLRDALARPRG